LADHKNLLEPIAGKIRAGLPEGDFSSLSGCVNCIFFSWMNFKDFMSLPVIRQFQIIAKSKKKRQNRLNDPVADKSDRFSVGLIFLL